MKGISALPGVPILLTTFEGASPSCGAVLISFERFGSVSRVTLTRVGPAARKSLREPRLWRTGEESMVVSQAETLRKAIENLIDAKLHDALSRPGGLERLTAHRVSGVASFDIRNAERKLQQTLAEILSTETVSS